jgi:carboxyl-terminal processing protease
MWLGKIFFANSLSDFFNNSNTKQSADKNVNSENKLQSILNYIQYEYVDTINKDSLIELTIQSLLQNLDPHSVYIPPSDYEEMNDPLEGEFDGIGIEFSLQSDTIVVMNTIIGGPSEKIGILAGDRIIKVNDSTVAGVNISNNKVMKLLKGPKGTKVNVQILRRNVTSLLKFEIIRDKIPMHSIDAAMMTTKDIGYIKIARFAKTTPDEFHSALEKLHQQGMKNVIIDVRGNGGGYMDAAISIADEFLKNGELIVYTEGRAQPKKEFKATSTGIAEKDGLVILMDEWSASASEILAGAIQDNDRGIIIGRRSFGKGLVQEPIIFNDGSSVRLTVARYHTPSGRCIQRNYKTNTMDYYADLLYRNDSTDTIDKKHTPKFYTLKGRVVYGNGGITPDIKIENAKKDIPEFFYTVVNQSLIYQFAFKYSDEHRKEFLSYKKWNELDKYLIHSSLYNNFIESIKKQQINPSQQDIQKAKPQIMNLLRAFIIRNIFNDEGFYAVYLQNDEYVKKANELFLKKSCNQAINLVVLK